jgi:hypothetical protein
VHPSRSWLPGTQNISLTGPISHKPLTLSANLLVQGPAQLGNVASWPIRLFYDSPTLAERQEWTRLAAGNFPRNTEAFWGM